MRCDPSQWQFCCLYSLLKLCYRCMEIQLKVWIVFMDFPPQCIQVFMESLDTRDMRVSCWFLPFMSCVSGKWNPGDKLKANMGAVKDNRSFYPQKIILSSLLAQSEKTSEKTRKESMIFFNGPMGKFVLDSVLQYKNNKCNIQFRHKTYISTFSAPHNCTWLLHKPEASCIFTSRSLKHQN